MGFVVVSEQLGVIPFTNILYVSILFFRGNVAELSVLYLPVLCLLIIKSALFLEPLEFMGLICTPKLFLKIENGAS